MPEPLEPISAALSGAIGYTRSGERILAVLAALVPVATGLDRIREGDPELEPEIDAARAHVAEAGDALARAFLFIEARSEANLAAIKAAVESLAPPNEGGPE